MTPELGLFVGIVNSGAATILATQLLKHIPFKFEDNRKNAAVVSLLASIYTAVELGLSVSFSDIPAMVTIFVGTALIATATYNNLVKKGE